MRHRFRTTQWLPYPVDFVFAFFADPSNLPELMPKWQQARIDEIELHPARPKCAEALDGRIAAGRGTRLNVSFRPAPLAPLRASWVALIEDFHWNERFCDRQIEGPFRYWRHCHRVQEWQHDRTGEYGTLLIDSIEYELPFGRLGRIGNQIAVKQMLNLLFEYRHRRAGELLRELSERVECHA